MPRAKTKPAAPKTFSEKQSIAVLQATIRDMEDRHSKQIAERDAYVEGIEQQALDAMKERNIIEQQLVDLLNLRKIIADAVLPGAYANEAIEQALRRVALGLAAGDVPRAHRGLNDSIRCAKVANDKLTEATLISDTDLFDTMIESALQHAGVITVGDLISRSEDDLYRKTVGSIGHSLGRSRLGIVLNVRVRLIRQLEKSADAFATRRATA
jgi:hypothetical protein